MEVATNIFDRLAAEKGKLMGGIFAEVELLIEEPMAGARQASGFASRYWSLLFSHAAESVIASPNSLIMI